MIGKFHTLFFGIATSLLLVGTLAHAEEEDKLYLKGEGSITVDESQKGEQSEAGTSETPLPKDKRDEVDDDARTAIEEE